MPNGQSALRTIERPAWLIGSYIGHLLIEAVQNLGRIGQDAIDGVRFLLLLRAQRHNPQRTAQIDSSIVQLRDEHTKRWSAWRAISIRRRIEVRAVLALLALTICFTARSYIAGNPSLPFDSGGSIAQLTDQAWAEAGKWHSDAKLVQIELSNFGFAMGPSGLPDMSKAGPPGLVLFNFISPSAHDAIRIVAEPKLTAEQLKFMKSQGAGPVRVEHLQTPYSPYTLPITGGFIDPEQAIAQAQKDLSSECSGASLVTQSCSLVSGAELHIFWSGQGETGRPIWTIHFGQNPKTLQIVSREVSATSGELVELADLQRGSINPEPGQEVESISLPNVGNNFDSVWRAVNDAVAQRDALYRPYAATLIAYLRDNPKSNSALYLSEAEFQYARITPSFYWDDRIVHVKWAGSKAVLDFSPATPRHAPEEPAPRTMTAENLPNENDTVRKILDTFPTGYAEQYTTWERGCQQMLTVSPKIKRWECGVLVPTLHRTDQVYIWMTRQGNPYWESAAAPLPSEHTLVSTVAPKDSWVMWTRVKHVHQWQYVIVNAATGVPTTDNLCTAPPDANGSGPPAVEACR